MDRRIIKIAPILSILFLLFYFWASPGWIAAGKQDALLASLTPAAVTPAFSMTETDTATPTLQPTPTLTPLPPEYQETPDQTIGILFGAVFLVIIIVGGTFFTIRRKR